MGRSLQLGVLLAVTVVGVLGACAANETHAPVYLTEEIPPCTPANGMERPRFPCEYSNQARYGFSNGDFTVWGESPWSLASYVREDDRTAHVVVRASNLPNTARCNVQDSYRLAPWHGSEEFSFWSRDIIRCYVDVRVNSYIYGTGPPVLTLSVRERPGSDTASEARRINDGPRIGREEILFLGPSWDYNAQVYQEHAAPPWQLGYREDGTVLALHPAREHWLDVNDSWRPTVEMTLKDFKMKVAAEYTAFLARFDGKVSDLPGAPALLSDANKLHDFYMDAGAMEQPGGPPVPPPPSCGNLVPSQLEDPSLVLDCVSLLGLKDDLRGNPSGGWSILEFFGISTAGLNWSTDRAIADWDGVRMEDGRVVALELQDKGLTGAVPSMLAELTALKELRLSGNDLTGCIPPALREVATHDLDALGLPDCG